MSSEWISVEDRFPEDYSFVLVCVCRTVVYVGRYNHGKKLWRLGRDTKRLETFITVTHWMPLPDPPKATHA